MNNLDIILLIATLIGFVFGYIKGLISQLTFGMGVVIGLLQAVLFYPAVAGKILAWTGWNDMLCNVLSFISIILVIVLIFKIFGWLIAKTLEAINLGFIDRTLGALFSTVIAILLVIGAVNSARSLMPQVKMFDKTTENQSMLYKHVQDVTLSILGDMKKEIDE